MNARTASPDSTTEHRPEVLAVIPARGGSKGLPRKNVLPLGGLPLMAWSIRAARNARAVTRVVVSTDDEEMAAVAREHGAEVPFLRPHELAEDRSNIMDAVNHVLGSLKRDEGYVPAAFCTLYPTHPFRAPGLVDELTRILVEQNRMVLTAKRLAVTEHSYLIPDAAGCEFLDPGPDREHIFRPYGVYEGKPTTPCRRGMHIHVLDDPIQLMDIDTPRDLRLAEALVEQGLFPVPEAPCA